MRKKNSNLAVVIVQFTYVNFLSIFFFNFRAINSKLNAM